MMLLMHMHSHHSLSRFLSCFEAVFTHSRKASPINSNVRQLSQNWVEGGYVVAVTGYIWLLRGIYPSLFRENCNAWLIYGTAFLEGGIHSIKKNVVELWCLCCMMMFKWTNKQPGIQRFWNLCCHCQDIYEWISPLNKRSDLPFYSNTGVYGEKWVGKIW